MNEIINSVWYLPSENTWKEFNLLAMRDSGTLSINKDELIFKGRKYKEIVIKNIQSISYGKQGRDFVNNWVKLEFLSEKGIKESAFFADGNIIGWSGIFGGTKALFNNIKLTYKL
jgi:hypothetical protein